MPNDDAGQLEGQVAEATDRVRQLVVDALELSKFVVETGVTDSDGHPLAFADIDAIQNAAATMGIITVSSVSPTAHTLTKQDWSAFEQAYYRLAIATRPITAETLRNTRYAAGAGGAAARTVFTWRGMFERICGYSPAQRFTRLLWLITVAFAAFVVVTQWRINALGMLADADSVKVKKELWQAVQPWAYGGLGACAYLLRSGHYYIYARTFDLRRTPEYFNRILLGALSGGAIILFVDYLVSQEDSVSNIGTTAFGFIAGYSSDFLFNTIERIVTAIFPKVDVETVARDDKPKRPTKPAPQGSGSGNSSGSGGTAKTP